MRIYFIIRGSNVQDQIDEVIKGEPHLILKMGESPLPQNGKILIKTLDLKHATYDEGKLLPKGKEETVIFDVADHVGNSKTGDIDYFVFAKEVREL